MADRPGWAQGHRFRWPGRRSGAQQTRQCLTCGGIAFGQLLPSAFHVIGDATVAHVNMPVAVLVWLMIVPMLLKIDLAALGQVGRHWRGIASTVQTV